MYDFNVADEQTPADLIPIGTICQLELMIRMGGVGEGGWLRRSKDGNSAMLDCEFTVLEGQYARRRMWANFTVEGPTEGHAKAAAISRSKLRAILESAHGIADLTYLPEALRQFIEERRWTCWKWIQRTSGNGEVKWTKPPFHPCGQHTKSNDPATHWRHLISHLFNWE